MKSPALQAVLYGLICVWSYTEACAIKFPQRFKILLRSLGFGLVALVKHEEPPKILVYRSRLLALAHCAVHIIPAAGSFALVALNFQGRFIGAELQGKHFATDDVKLGAIQVAAKLHGLQLLYSRRRGLRLGLSVEAHIGSTVIYFGYNTFGDSLPTADDGVGSEELLWPTYLDSDALQNYDCSTIEAQIYDPRCPSAGYDFLYQHFKTWWQFPDTHSLLEFNLQDYSMVKHIYATVSDNPGSDTVAFTSHWATAMLQDAKRDLYDKSLVWLRDNHRFDPPYPGYLDLAASKTFAVQTEVPWVRTACMGNFTIDITKETLTSPIFMPFPASDEDWGIPREWEEDDSSNEMLNQINSPIPYFSREVDTVTAIQQYFQDKGFLILQEDGNMTLSNTIPAVIAIPIELPVDIGTGLGIVVLVPSANTTIFSAFSCTVDSFWQPGRSVIESGEKSNRGFHDFVTDRVRNVVTTTLGVEGGAPAYFDCWRVIHINTSWYELLSPTLSDSVDYGSLASGRVSSSMTRSLMERLLEIVLYPLFEDPISGLPSVRSVEHVVSTYFADGLSRCGSTIQNNASGVVGWYSFRPDDNDMARSLVFKGSPRRKGVSAKPDLLINHNATEMLMTAVFTGYLLAAIGSFDYFAVAILLLHAAMAIFYTVFVFLSHPEIMEALDTIPEMVAMAQNSPPPNNDGLKNTCSGIRNLKTLGRVAIVEASQALDGSDGKEDLILRFQETTRDVQKIPEVGEIYGAIESP
ncbi:hypothetical protein E0Z10_g6071 [Xylaria hypoxylon]|uniref:Uncharacterized protein n=1 Tax=Xylaria hypoxylon TaxID=37992 RepID=A0A4Z0YTE8_9PEZI|nr:hypothetical protein E0Z10_g6071 [Xylaria hypoxylon]